MAGFIWKPGTRKGAVFLAPNQGNAPVVTTSGGKKVTLVRGDQAGGVFAGHDGYQWVVPRESYSEVVSDNNLSIDYNGQTGKIGSGKMSYRGGDLASWQESNKTGFQNDAGFSDGSNVPEGLMPNSFGTFGVFPGFLGGMYPQPNLVDFDPITYDKMKAAGYNFTDPMQFAKEYGQFNRDEIIKNQLTAKNSALDQLDTELKGLEGYAPAAAALKRRETTVDNIFNQGERARAVESALPGAKKDLEDQASRARAFAEGRAPDTITDRALELNSRSRSADQATAGGFGANSSVARKSSDLRSADERIKLSQYGDQLLTSNISNKASLLLPPTEYSDAGQQIKVTPTLSGAQLQSNAQAQIDSNTLINPTNALASKVQQNQFKTNLDQQTNMFNTSNALNTKMFNANGEFQESTTNAQIQNQFALGLFNYMAGYAGSIASAAATDVNTNLAIAQQQEAQKIFQQYLGQTQKANEVGAITNGITTAVGAAAGLLSTVTSGTGNSGGQVTGTDGQTIDTQLPGFDTNLTPDSGSSGSNDINNGQLPGFSTDPSMYDSGSSDSGFVSNDSGGYDLSAGGQDQLNYSPAGFSDTFRVLKEVPGGNNLNEKATAQLIKGANVTLGNLGVHNTPAEGTVPQINSQGRPVYVAQQSEQSANNAAAGGTFVNTIKGVLDPLGAFSKDDTTAIDKIATVANDTAFAAQLTGLVQRGDQQGFVTALGSRVAGSLINNSGMSGENKAGLQAAATAANVFTNWQNMSPAQRSMAVAQIGLQGYKFSTGESLGQKVIPGTQVPNGTGMTIGQGLGLLAQGYNVYAMVDRWGDLNTIQQVTGGVQTAAGIAQTAQQLGIIGVGPGNAAVAVNASQLASSGYQISSAYGVGALTGPANASIPAGYSQIGTTAANEIIVAPTANAGSSALAAEGAQASTAAASADVAAAAEALPSTGAQIATGLGYVASAASVVMGAKTIYDGWGKSDGSYRGPLNGAIGGASMGAGLSGLTGGAAAPLIVGFAVAGALANSWGTSGKSVPQQARDAVRDMYVEKGFADEDGMVTLADGSKASIGMDGHEGRREWRNPQLAGEVGKRQLNSYDTDFTNPLDLFAGMQGTALTRLLSGGVATHIEQVGSQTGNAALANVGFGQDLTETNFNKMRDNMRTFYAKNGIKSLAEGYALNNQAFAEHRLTDSQHIQNQQALDMLFKADGYKFSQQLAKGVVQGVTRTVPKNEEQLNNYLKPSQGPSGTPSNYGDNNEMKTGPLKINASKEDLRNAISRIVAGKRGSSENRLRA